MNYFGMPWALWKMFRGSFQKNLSTVLGYTHKDAANITKRALKTYQEIIAALPHFNKRDRFKMNIVSCAIFSAFLLEMDPKPTLEKATSFYEQSMMTPLMKQFCRMSARNKFSAKDLRAMRATEALRAADANPYSWNMELYVYPDDSGYEARFTHCGICVLMKERGLFDYVPAMCRLDYAMSEAGGASIFFREFTLAEGGPYCDCGYKKKSSLNPEVPII